MHGYQLIDALEERSGGAWRPSPGSIYPALTKLEERGFIVGEEIDGKRRFELTDAGRERLTELQEEHADAPWEQESTGRRGEFRRALGELYGPAKQIGRYGTPEQADAAQAVFAEATAKLYRILADGVAPDTEPDAETN